MWLSPEAEHTCRGKLRDTAYCTRCHCPIEKGQRYRRRAVRYGNKYWRGQAKRLTIDHEHLDDRDCPYWLEEELPVEMCVAEAIPLSVHLVLKEEVVLAYDMAGKLFAETRSVLSTELVVGNQEENISDDTEEDIAF